MTKRTRTTPQPQQWYSASDVRAACAHPCAPSAALVRHPVQTLAQLTHPKSVRQACGYGHSQTAFAQALTQAERLAYPNERIKPWERSRVSHSERGQITPRYQADCLLLLEQTVRRYHPTLHVRGNFSDPARWHFAAFKICANTGCAREFKINQLTQKLCPECRK